MCSVQDEVGTHPRAIRQYGLAAAIGIIESAAPDLDMQGTQSCNENLCSLDRESHPIADCLLFQNSTQT